VNFLVPVDDAEAVWKKLIDGDPPAGVQPCSLGALEIHRIERGFPVYGKELTEDVNPLEAGLERFVSFTKGCYIGQEVIARLDTYKKLQKRLVGLLLDENAVVRQGARVTAQGNEVGWVTSAAQSPRLNRTIALAYVRSAWAVPNTGLDMATESGAQEAQVVQLPFEG
jgi:aminomethyltransferase